jgi:hypothetical protein
LHTLLKLEVPQHEFSEICGYTSESLFVAQLEHMKGEEHSNTRSNNILSRAPVYERGA